MWGQMGTLYRAMKDVGVINEKLSNRDECCLEACYMNATQRANVSEPENRPPNFSSRTQSRQTTRGGGQGGRARKMEKAGTRTQERSWKEQDRENHAQAMG